MMTMLIDLPSGLALFGPPFVLVAVTGRSRADW
jgi:hypothetical protein